MKNRKNRGKLGVQERMNSIKLVQFLLTPLIHPSLPYIQFSPLNPVVTISYSTNYPQLAYTAGIVTNYQLSTNIATHRSTTHTHTHPLHTSIKSIKSVQLLSQGFHSIHKNFCQEDLQKSKVILSLKSIYYLSRLRH